MHTEYSEVANELRYHVSKGLCCIWARQSGEEAEGGETDNEQRWSSGWESARLNCTPYLPLVLNTLPAATKCPSLGVCQGCQNKADGSRGPAQLFS